LGECHGICCGMRRTPGKQERLAGFFVVVGSAIVFGPVVWLLKRWSEAVERDPASTWGARWLGEHLSAHPYLTGGALLLGLVLSSGLVMLMVVYAAKRLAWGRNRAEKPGTGTQRE
jgi:hypothetical protein